MMILAKESIAGDEVRSDKRRALNRMLARLQQRDLPGTNYFE